MSLQESIELRKAELSYLKEIIEFGKKQAYDSYIQGYKEEDLLIYLEEEYNEFKFNNYINNNENIFIISKALSTDKIVGYILVTKCLLEIEEVNKEKDFEIKKLYVDENFRGIGLGSKLVKEIINVISEKYKIEKRNIKSNEYQEPKIFINVWIQNKQSQRFYEKHNFIFIKTNGIPVGGVIDYDKVYVNNFKLEQ